MNLRRIKKTDFPVLFEINNSTQACPWSEKALQSEIEVDHPYSVVLEDGGEILGYIFVRGVGMDYEIMSMAVRKARQGEGLGSYLLSRVLNLCRNNSLCKNVHLEVSTSNTMALKLYKSHGFQSGRVRPGYYSDGTAALEMSLRLT